MTKEATQSHKTEEHRARRTEPGADRAPADQTGAPDHPLIELQHLAGNRAVQRLVAGGRWQQPQTVQRAVIRRVLSPATTTMGRSATGDLLSSWAGLYQRSAAITGQATLLDSAVFDLLNPITMVQATLAVAENEPAPGGAGGTQVTPVTPTPVPVPSNTPEPEQ